MGIESSNELFINMKNIPSTNSEEYKAFFEEERRKCENGVTIGGVFISPWLYWHTNHWKILADKEDNKRPMITPKLRDNEWIIAEGITRAETERKALCVIGLRQFGKSDMSSSYSGMKATFIKGGQNVIVGGSRPDLNNITQYIDFGLQNVTPYFRIPRITRDWSKSEVYLGVKSKDGDNKIHSSFRIRNTESGRNTEAVAGSTTSSLIFDEIAKSDYIQVFESAKPSLIGEFGWRCSPLLMATGGSFNKSRDAETMFFHPDSNDILEFIDEQTNKRTGLFVAGWYRTDCKFESNLAEYLKQDNEELRNIPILVSDKEKAIATLKAERAVLAKDPDVTKLLKRTMYYPLDVEEIFLSESGNIFPKDLLLEQKSWLAAGNAPHCDYVELYTDSDNQIKHRFTDKKPILHYPSRQDDNINGVVQIWEFPIFSSVPGLYIAATDPYKQPLAAYSDSVGSTYIFKRIYDPLNDKFQNIIVAAYHGRPRKMETWHDTTKMLLKYYSARTVCENEDRSFIDYCKNSNEAHTYLVPQVQQIIDGVHPNSLVDRGYGVHATTELINHFNTSIVFYMQETLKTETIEGITKEVLGVRRIIDPVLIEELLKYDGDMNADRIRAFGIVLAYAKSLDRSPINITKDNRYNVMSNNSKINNKNPFRKALNPFVVN